METPRKFITAVINLRGVSTNKTIIYFIAMQTYKELISSVYAEMCYLTHARVSAAIKLKRLHACKAGHTNHAGPGSMSIYIT